MYQNHENSASRIKPFWNQMIQNNTLYIIWHKKLPTQYQSYGDLPALLVEDDLKCPSVHYSDINGHLSRTTDVP
jgi:hypothetical protein